jgi:hypothetical protein
MSLLDLPGRKLAVVGLKKDFVVSVDELTFTANPGGGRFWSGTKQIFKRDLETTLAGQRVIVSYRLQPADFPILTGLQNQ